MIVVRGVHHAFIFQIVLSEPGSTAITLFDSKGRILLVMCADKLNVQRHRFEVARVRVGHHLVEIDAGGGDELASQHPAGSRQPLSAAECRRA